MGEIYLSYLLTVFIILGVVALIAIINEFLSGNLWSQAKPLTEEDLKICERIVSEGKGYLFCLSEH